MFSNSQDKPKRLQPYYAIDIIVLISALIIWFLFFLNIFSRELMPLVIGVISLSFFIRTIEQWKLNNKSSLTAYFIAAVITLVLMIFFLL
ncbi:hypothetical protein [Evansella halocellulosilytica]|uniref:hypothetical protein n=1 Tax=Evansella halocellulosilytica TaxID=2011013 RepID=UPI000BB69775|nr:hypothetical protein [Evansella halocellulosilytica]